ncbi:CpsD/CapB family tyrosine-protein kinase [Paratractidigestivibacter sp.]|uniref:CpsD/CapB family tyrosine-protein kinase n=2 Tax=Paratractidigestivibacter sp. TaxID=2847316 RepID=UPI002AC9A737|nr:CpsD/CapB family tyrosine-protein kinase [Paratractidigestivibacter sp.]
MFASNKSQKMGKGDRVYLQNSVKTLVANIRFASVDNPVHTLVVTSAVPNEGKTAISVALGQAIAAGGKDVIIVDCDLRRRSIANEMGIHTQHGLYAVLANQVTLEEAVVETDTPGLHFLDVEPHIPNPVDILASKRFGKLVARLRREYAFVIIDTPPVSAFVDAAIISQVADATLLVVRQGFTKRADILAAYDQLKKADANVIGTVMNFCDSERSEYYYNYYNKDGKRVRRSGGSDSSSPAPKLPDVPLSQGVHTATDDVADSMASAEDIAAAPAALDADATNAGTSAVQQGSVPGPKSLPNIDFDGAADSTMAFLAQSGYKPKTSFDD